MLYTPKFTGNNFGIHWEGGGGLSDLCGGPSVVLEILVGKSKIWIFWKFENFEILENYG